MKLGYFSIFLCILAAFFISPVFALDGLDTKPVNISILSEKDAVLPGECNKYIATVQNNDIPQRVDFIIEGEELSWITLGDAYFDFDENPIKKVIFYICPPLGTPSETYNFVFKARTRLTNYSNPEPFALYVIERPYLEIRDVTTSKDLYKLGESVDFSVNVRNLGLSDAKKIKILVEISGRNAPEKMRLEIPLIEPQRGNSASGKFDFDRYSTGGDYEISASIIDDIGDVLYKKTAFVTIEEKSELNKETVVKNSALSKTVVLSGSNTGNKKETLVLQSSGISYLALYSFDPQPDSITESAGKKVFKWNCDLAPGESCRVSYHVEYWLFVVVIIASFGILYLVYSILEKPHIKKKVIKGRDREHTVHITIKNKSRNTLFEVHVFDKIPEIVSVVPKSFSPSIKPTVKGKKGGNEVTWTFAKLEPGEERILTYKIRPLVMLMGNIKLPKAKIHAVNAKGKKYKAESAVMVD